jgi:2-phospho-L-lactate/phosphoenolpyruvate guanylyltransferase
VRVVAVPVKPLERAKRRLAGVLSPAERAVLVLAMLEDVLDACLAQPGWTAWVVSGDEAALEVAARRGARAVLEEGSTLLQACRQLEAEAGGPAGELAVVLGDLPYLSSRELREALAVDSPVVAAPAASDGGTNLLVRRPPTVIPARFGRASFAKHRWAARRSRVELREVRGPGLERDLDRPQDVVRLIESRHPGRSRDACLEMGLAERLLTA